VTLSDNNGATTTANLTTVNANGPSASGSSNQLLNGYIYSVNSPLSATITGIPYSQYSLYAYMVDATIGNSEEVIIGGKTYYFGTTNSASYMQITNTTPGSYPTGNYAVATGLTGNTQTVTVQGLNQPYGPLAGFEIVHTAPTTLPSNAVTLSSDSTIDVTGPANGSITGLFTIGGNRLSLSGGGSGANTAYSLTLGNSGGVSIIGNPTFDVANNGSGTGTLILGALNDGGTTRTITKSDLGALTLGAAASAMNADDIVNINGGTLKSNNATALGTRTAVNVASGATFALGASQALGALGDSGTVVVNGASVQLNGNALTVGSGNNLSSTFSGVIANGTGGAGSLVKAGAGSLVLRGNNTYTGPTTVSQGDLLVNGSLASPVTVTSGGILGGMGSLILLRKFRAICSG
jgi:autotransporter-associated beta strand protein